MSNLDAIKEALGEDELLCQLAEEGAELAHAALKLRRCITQKNPTPVKLEDAEANLIEELADILLVAEIVRRWSERAEEITAIANRKEERWMQRIEEAKNGR